MSGYEKYFTYLLVAVGTVFFVWLASNSPKKQLRKNYTTMGTYLSFTVHPSGPEARRAVKKAREEVERINDVFSSYRSESLTSKVNDSSGSYVKVTPEFIHLLDKASVLHKRTGGRFDITVGPLVDLWGFYDRKHELPSNDRVQAHLSQVDFDSISYTDTGVKLAREDMRLDFGALAKGYAVDRAVEVLREHDLKNFLVDLGGNIYAAGKAPENRPWTVGVQNPRRDELDGTLELEDEAVGTSGDYERSFVHDGKRYSHIINARTGWPVEGMAATTVVAGSALKADMYSTALFLTKGEITRERPQLDNFLYVKTGPEELHYVTTEQFMRKITGAKNGLSRAEVINTP